MKRYVDNQYSTWKVFLDSYLREFGGAFLTKYNYDVRFLPGNSIRNTEWALYKTSSVTTLADGLMKSVGITSFHV